MMLWHAHSMPDTSVFELWADAGASRAGGGPCFPWMGRNRSVTATEAYCLIETPDGIVWHKLPLPADFASVR